MSAATSSYERRGIFIAEVTANDLLCEEHYRLRLSMEEFPPSFPGQFIQLQCRPLQEQISLREVKWAEKRLPVFTQSELTDHEPFLRRPLSLAGRSDLESGRVDLEIIYRVIGTGTRWLGEIGAGVRLSVLGPLGNAFRVSPDKPLAVLVGGGVGIPPMLYLAEALAAAGKETVAFAGSRTAQLLPLTGWEEADFSSTGHPTRCVDEFDAFGVPTSIATDDGSLGFGGMVSEAFRNWLNAHVENPSQLVVYCCGPEPLMQAVGDICISRDIECQLAMERHMACGMGTCQSCIVRIRDHNERGWSFKLCCTDGPVFDAKNIVW